MGLLLLSMTLLLLGAVAVETNMTAEKPKTSPKAAAVVAKPDIAKMMEKAMLAADRAIKAAGGLDTTAVEEKALAAQERTAATKTSKALPKTSPVSPNKLPFALHGAASVSASSAVTMGAAPPPKYSGAGCASSCSGHGECDAAEKKCTCKEGYSGEICDIAPCPQHCNGKGTCVNQMCACNPNFYGEACEFERCLDDCAGHGTCNGDGTCTCEIEYKGLNCNVPSGLGGDGEVAMLPPKKLPQVNIGKIMGAFKMNPEPVCPEKCNGNGKCQPGGTCSCFVGYSGAACQNFCPNFCSGQGQCVDGACLCLASYGGVDCSIKICCSGHGDCTVPDTCICDAGWMGAQCEMAMSCADPECSGHGTCEAGSCTCDPGWSDPICKSPPKECGPCPPGGECDRESGVCMCGPSPCPTEDPAAEDGADAGAGKGGSKRGGGKGSKKGGIAIGAIPASSKKAPAGGGKKGAPDAPAAAAKKAADDAKKAAKKVADAKKAAKKVEEMHCPGYSKKDDIEDCHGHGMCLKGKCLCTAGWGGPADPADCKEPVCPISCGEHGKCQGGVCTCQMGWTGPACREPSCGPRECSGHGLCSFVAPNSPAQCLCEHGFTGDDCSKTEFQMTTLACPNACSGNGLCLNGKCICTEGFYGGDCSNKICPNNLMGPRCNIQKCPNDCDGKGLCMNGVCSCWGEFLGIDCSIPIQCFSACNEKCGPGLTKSEACEFCKGQCMTLGANPVIGNHNAFQDVITLQTGEGPPHGHKHHEEVAVVDEVPPPSDWVDPAVPRVVSPSAEETAQNLLPVRRPRHQEAYVVDVPTSQTEEEESGPEAVQPVSFLQAAGSGLLRSFSSLLGR